MAVAGAESFHGRHARFRCRPAAPLRPSRPALHLVPDGPAIPCRLRRAGTPPGRRVEQRGPDPQAPVALRARPVLREPLLLLRLQPRDHARQDTRGRVPRTAVPGDRPRGGPVRSRPRADPGALRRRHAELPVSGAIVRNGRHDRNALPYRTGCRSRHLDRTRPAPRRHARHRATRRVRLQSGQPRRAGFRPRRPGGRQSRPGRRRNARGRRCVPRAGIPLRQHRPDLRVAEADRGRLQPNPGHGGRHAAGPRRRLRLRAHAGLVQAATQDRRIHAARSGSAPGPVAAGDRTPHAGRLSLHRHGPLRAAGRRPRRRAGAGCIATSWGTRRMPTAISSASA